MSIHRGHHDKAGPVQPVVAYAVHTSYVAGVLS